MSITNEISVTVRKIASKKGYDIAENKRLIIHSKPILNYQPDFFLINKDGICIIELEITTDATKSVIGDIVRSGLIGAHKFAAISKSKKSATLIKNYGLAITNRIAEFKNMKIYSLYYKNDTFLKKELEKII